ncbi:unnamed protein product [Cunninghamella echinulata]
MDKIKDGVKRWNKEKIGLKLKKMFGYNDNGIGILDINSRLWWYNFLKERYTLLTENIKQVDICQNLQSAFLLSEKGIVTTYQLSDNNNNYKYKNQYILELPQVFDMAVSVNHVLFAVEGSPCIYALGNNHYSQLGLDPYQFRFLHPHQPQPIDFFNGLCYLNETNHHIVSVSCGPFHSAVIINQDLYTFGWKQKGLLAWEEEEEGEEENGLIQLACFKTVNDQSIEVPINKVACGSTHTVAIDDNKNVWICGQNKYFQLGMDDEMKVAFQFEKCSQVRNAIDCATAPWSTLIIENTKNC